MKIKIKSNVSLTHEQFVELGTVLQKPDMGWEVDTDHILLPKQYTTEHEGEHGFYVYRVNRSLELITILEVE